MITGTNHWKVSFQRKIEYELEECPYLFEPDNHELISIGKSGSTHRFVVLDNVIDHLYGAEIRDYFDYHHVNVKIVTLPGGESNKSLQNFSWIVKELDSFPIHRRDEPIIAIGGGVTTDLVGFVAGSYRRGVPHIKIPTTLIGYVDAAVGIKSGVNFNGHKNRLGAFEPPVKVLLDRTFLRTLPPRHLLNGVCEILKLAIIADAPLFDMLEADGATCIQSKFQDEPGETILRRSIQRMLAELEPNLFEDDLTRKVDFGHTFCYGLEASCQAVMLHGEAVLIDMLFSTVLASRRGLLSQPDMLRIFSLVKKLGITPTCVNVGYEVLWDSLLERVVHRNGMQRVPLPAGIGKCTFINDLQAGEVRSAWQDFIVSGKVEWQEQKMLNLVKS